MAVIYGKYPSGYKENINGSSQDDSIYPLGGSDYIDGGPGKDTVVIAAQSTAFRMGTVNGTVYLDSITAASAGDNVTFRNVEFLKFNDKTVSLEVSDIYTNVPGSEFFDGGAGVDTLIYTGIRSDYVLSASGESNFLVRSINGTEGTDNLVSIERLKFLDTMVALDIDGIGGQAYRIYKAAFARTPDLGGLGFWISVMDRGATSLRDVAAGFIGSEEFRSLYGASPSHEALITGFYSNILGRAPDPGGAAFWVGILNDRADTVAGVLSSISESAENKAAVIGVINDGFEYTLFS